VPELAPDGFSEDAKLTYLPLEADFAAAFCRLAASLAVCFWALASAFWALDCLDAPTRFNWVTLMSPWLHNEDMFMGYGGGPLRRLLPALGWPRS